MPQTAAATIQRGILARSTRAMRKLPILRHYYGPILRKGAASSMASIRIERAHRFNLKEARHAVTHLAEKLAERFDIDWNWHRNTLKFQRSGVSGCIEVQRGSSPSMSNWAS
ncbi:MAG: polyhydroxyalkanoic acid system family protein [Xanthomonadales bacterium]|nr:polyhydroxyalkanoic acid system family protein [Xanthomonadales bacterium]